jgi:hypothetical protein
MITRGRNFYGKFRWLQGNFDAAGSAAASRFDRLARSGQNAAS